MEPEAPKDPQTESTLIIDPPKPKRFLRKLAIGTLAVSGGAAGVVGGVYGAMSMIDPNGKHDAIRHDSSNDADASTDPKKQYADIPQRNWSATVRPNAGGKPAETKTTEIAEAVKPEAAKTEITAPAEVATAPQKKAEVGSYVLDLTQKAKFDTPQQITYDDVLKGSVDVQKNPNNPQKFTTFMASLDALDDAEVIGRLLAHAAQTQNYKLAGEMLVHTPGAKDMKFKKALDAPVTVVATPETAPATGIETTPALTPKESQVVGNLIYNFTNSDANDGKLYEESLKAFAKMPPASRAAIINDLTNTEYGLGDDASKKPLFDAMAAAVREAAASAKLATSEKQPIPVDEKQYVPTETVTFPVLLEKGTPVASGDIKAGGVAAKFLLKAEIENAIRKAGVSEEAKGR